MKTLVITVLAAAFIATAYGLKCYTCEGGDSAVKEGDCGDTFDKTDSLLKTCNDSAGEVWCRKQKTGANHVYTHIERGCAAQCEERNVAYVDRVTCCNTDGCNSAGSLTGHVILVGAAGLLAVFRKLIG